MGFREKVGTREQSATSRPSPECRRHFRGGPLMPFSRTLLLVCAAVATLGCDRFATSPTRTRQLTLAGAPAFDDTGADGTQGVSGHYEFVGINTGNDFTY